MEEYSVKRAHMPSSRAKKVCQLQTLKNYWFLYVLRQTKKAKKFNGEMDKRQQKEKK